MSRFHHVIVLLRCTPPCACYYRRFLSVCRPSLNSSPRIPSCKETVSMKCEVDLVHSPLEHHLTGQAPQHYVTHLHMMQATQRSINQYENPADFALDCLVGLKRDEVIELLKTIRKVQTSPSAPTSGEQRLVLGHGNPRAS